jgi:hypothetical protein
MFGCGARVRVATIVVLILFVLTPRVSDARPVDATIFAGTGALGIDDGPADHATFLMPAALALGPQGLVIADTAAQRIRLVDSRGVVTTLAGGGAINASGVWVDGGYRDGAALDARFNAPDGVAVLPNGIIVVSDRDNHCLRAIDHGRVTTFAGAAGVAGSADGSREAARFTSPRAVAVDTDGTIYVADWGVGIRAIKGDVVSTMHVAGITFDRPTGVAIGHLGPYDALLVADVAGLVRVMLPSLEGSRFRAFPESIDTSPIQSSAPLGIPYSVSAFNVGDLVVTDLADSAVKYVRLVSYVDYLGAVPPEDAILSGGAATFSTTAPRYDAPMGSVTARDGTVYVADTGNRRIVRIAPFARSAPIRPDSWNDLGFPPKSYRVAVVGSSFTWYGSSAEDAIAGNLERDLTSVPALATKPPHAKSFVTTLAGEFDLISNVLSAGTVDSVVIVISPIDAIGLGLGPDPKVWGPVVHAGVVRAAKALAETHIPFLIVINPAPQTISPVESAVLFDQREHGEASDYDSEHQAMLAAIGDVDAPKLDLYPAFRAEIASPDHRSLFDVADVHYSSFGRAFVAAAIAKKLEEMQTW